MSEIIVRRDGVKWGAFREDKRITAAACQPCVVKVLMTILKGSEKYTSIRVLNEDGSTKMVIPIGVSYGRNTSKGI